MKGLIKSESLLPACLIIDLSQFTIMFLITYVLKGFILKRSLYNNQGTFRKKVNHYLYNFSSSFNSICCV